MKIEFIYDQSCPNIKKTRIHLLKAFAKTGVHPSWTEWDRNSDESPDYARQFGSPTILVDGNDIAGMVPQQDGNSCRIYLSGGVPSVSFISNALKKEQPADFSSRTTALFGSFAVGPGLGAAILAKAACPLCYPAIGGLLSSIGLGFLFEGSYFIILMGLFFAIALFGLVFRAKTRRGYAPFICGVLAVFIGGFARMENIDWLFYIGIGGLIAASIWNLIPKKKSPSCINQQT